MQSTLPHLQQHPRNRTSDTKPATETEQVLLDSQERIEEKAGQCIRLLIQSATQKLNGTNITKMLINPDTTS
jgi:hypothetical protein